MKALPWNSMRGGLGTEVACPTKHHRDDHLACARCGGYGTVWVHNPAGQQPVTRERR